MLRRADVDDGGPVALDELREIGEGAGGRRTGPRHAAVIDTRAIDTRAAANTPDDFISASWIARTRRGRSIHRGPRLHPRRARPDCKPTPRRPPESASCAAVPSRCSCHDREPPPAGIPRPFATRFDEAGGVELRPPAHAASSGKASTSRSERYPRRASRAGRSRPRPPRKEAAPPRGRRGAVRPPPAPAARPRGGPRRRAASGRAARRRRAARDSRWRPRPRRCTARTAPRPPGPPRGPGPAPPGTRENRAGRPARARARAAPRGRGGGRGIRRGSPPPRGSRTLRFAGGVQLRRRRGERVQAETARERLRNVTREDRPGPSTRSSSASTSSMRRWWSTPSGTIRGW